MGDLQQHTQVSVIIPIYNAEKYLRRCLDSVINQTHACMEVLLIDDGSTDASKNICEDYCNRDCRFRYVYQENQGAAVARNTGIDCATSEYITFLDSDDSMDPIFVERILGEMLATKADMGICDIYYISSCTDEKQISKIRFSDKTANANNTKSVFNTVRVFIWGKIYKRELFANIRFPNLKFFEDGSTIPFLAAISNQIVYIPLPLINYYRHRTDSLSENMFNIGDFIEALGILGERLRKVNLYNTFVDEYKKMCMGQLRFLYRRFGNKRNEKTLADLNKLKEYVLSVFPVLYPLTAHKFYINSGDSLLIQAADKAVLFNDQLVNNINIADYVICYSDCAPKAVSKPIIKLDRPDNFAEESVEYDMAEEIIMAM